jgi:hypothetical protein
MPLCEMQRALDGELKKIQKSAQTVEQIICDFILKKSSKMKKILKID